MRSTLWSRAGRPKLNGSCTSTSTSSACRPSVIRQTTSGPVRRKISVNDVFTLLLTPILATALLADTSWKDKRRKDWAHRIADIEAETEQIQSQATKSWQALQYRSLRLGATQQRRQYSAVALRSQREYDGDLSPDQPALEYQHLPLEEWEHEPTWFEATPKNAHNSADDPTEVSEDYHVSFTPQALNKSESLRRLLAIKLALNLTVYLNTGVSPSKVRREIRIPNITPNLEYDPVGSQGDLRRLLGHMRNICSTIEKLQQALPDGASPGNSTPLSADSEKLQNEIVTLSERYQTSSITMPEFVTAYTVAVLKSPVPPTSKAYLALFRGFARGSSLNATSHDLAMQTLFTWEQSKLPINDHDLFVILSELARRKHVQKFDGLMRDLTMSPSPINAISKWTWERVNDTQVPVPKSYHPALLTTLIHCALRFDQPQKAEAWSEILRRTWMDVNDINQRTPLSRLFTNWMRYYEVQGNWRRGVAWLDAAQKWTVTVASFDMYSLQRLAVGMLGLCLACGKSQEYEEILSAAIDSGIPSMDPEHFLKESSRRAICREWKHLYHEAYRLKVDTRHEHEKVKVFQSKVRAMVQRLLPEKDKADIEWRHEQEDKPSPLVEDPRTTKLDQNSAQAVALWQQIYAQNQEALKSSRSASKKWKVQCTLQEHQIRSLRSELEYQKNLVRELSSVRTGKPPPNQTDQKLQNPEKTDETQMAEKYEKIQKSENTDDAVAPHRILPEVTYASDAEEEAIPLRFTTQRAVHPRTAVAAKVKIGPRQTSARQSVDREKGPWVPYHLPTHYPGSEGALSSSDFLLSNLVKPPGSTSAQEQDMITGS